MENQTSSAFQESVDESGNRVITVPADYRWAGKYESINDLVAGYTNAAPVYQKNKELEQKLSSYNVPEDYSVPEGIQHLDESDIREIKALAKDSGFSQSHFEKFIAKQSQRISDSLSSYEKTKAEIGEDNWNKAEDFINQSYPEELREHMKDAFINDAKVRDRIIKERDAKLNSKVPGVSTIAPAQAPVTNKDLLEARRQTEMGSHQEREVAKAHYLHLIQVQHEQSRRGY